MDCVKVAKMIGLVTQIVVPNQLLCTMHEP